MVLNISKKVKDLPIYPYEEGLCEKINWLTQAIKQTSVKEYIYSKIGYEWAILLDKMIELPLAQS